MDMLWEMIFMLTHPAEKLYYRDAYLQSCETTIVEHGTDAAGTPYVVLAETVFYPTGGGQPCDLGTINGVEVIDVEEVDDKILHKLAQPLTAGEGKAVCQIDWQRRFDHMQQHNGQHILSAAFAELYQAETFGFHLGRETVTVDIMTEVLTDEMVQRVGELANSVVFDNREITARFVDPQELATLPLRKAPTVSENIRIVTIPDFDYNPCGGTHPKRTGEVGPILILGWERNKGGMRIEFVCGNRAIRAIYDKQRTLRELSRQLNSSESEMLNSLDRIITEQKETSHALQQAKGQLLEQEAARLVASAVAKQDYRIVSTVQPGLTMQELQKMSQIITAADPKAIALLAASGDKTQLVFARGTEVSIPMNALLKETLTVIDGKGGGKPESAQGGGQATVPAEEVLAHALGLLERQIQEASV
ncbi:alanyl-tRNA editing protein [Brevibacillus dissolubilis]|uniref:alanyl-tRNA editing protein n=1 Tax=Brevibacillus dissolubilis TaxID=1844116 RepID=UPI0021003A24|nr:DHHA1 domain-containing protein [Brevibacillus dissolubilis]